MASNDPHIVYDLDEEEEEDDDDVDETDMDFRTYLLGIQTTSGDNDDGSDYQRAEEEEQMEDEEADYVSVVGSSRVSEALLSTAVQAEVLSPTAPASTTEDDKEFSRVKNEEGKTPPFSDRDGEGGECSSQSETDGLFCPICMQAWTSEGEHHIWCERLSFYCSIED